MRGRRATWKKSNKFLFFARVAGLRSSFRVENTRNLALEQRKTSHFLCCFRVFVSRALFRDTRRVHIRSRIRVGVFCY